ncbi:MAG: hypothetical protein GY777_26045 [Candidatus Brocadiaceae bacterium]|nr:hypothetical protein [Candidatus Brocadiaceae bacterium]
MSFYALEYRSEELVAENDYNKLRIGHPQIILNECRMEFRWTDISHQPDSRPPYKLFLTIDDLTDDLIQIDIEGLQIISSLNKKYKFTKPGNLPVTVFKDTEIILGRRPYYWFKPELDFDDIDIKYGYKEYYSFRPVFDFDYKKKETITLIANLIIKTSESTRKKEIKIKYLPIEVKRSILEFADP